MKMWSGHILPTVAEIVQSAVTGILMSSEG